MWHYVRSRCCCLRSYIYIFFFFSERYLLTSPALRGNMFCRRAVAGLSLERCQLSEGLRFKRARVLNYGVDNLKQYVLKSRQMFRHQKLRKQTSKLPVPESNCHVFKKLFIVFKKRITHGRTEIWDFSSIVQFYILQVSAVNE